jgi:hypothetical protein
MIIYYFWGLFFLGFKKTGGGNLKYLADERH